MIHQETYIPQGQTAWFNSWSRKNHNSWQKNGDVHLIPWLPPIDLVKLHPKITFCYNFFLCFYSSLSLNGLVCHILWANIKYIIIPRMLTGKMVDSSLPIDWRHLWAQWFAKPWIAVQLNSEMNFLSRKEYFIYERKIFYQDKLH